MFVWCRQFPKEGIEGCNALVLTHDHADAILGLDDLRDLQHKEVHTHTIYHIGQRTYIHLWIGFVIRIYLRLSPVTMWRLAESCVVLCVGVSQLVGGGCFCVPEGPTDVYLSHTTMKGVTQQFPYLTGTAHTSHTP